MKKPSGPKSLSTLFEKYKKTLRAPEATVVNTFIEVVDEVLEITLQPTQLQFSPHNKQLIIKVGGPLKSEIMLHKKELLAHMTGRLGTSSAPKEII